MVKRREKKREDGNGGQVHECAEERGRGTDEPL